MEYWYIGDNTVFKRYVDTLNIGAISQAVWRNVGHHWALSRRECERLVKDMGAVEVMGGCRMRAGPYGVSAWHTVGMLDNAYMQEC